MRKVPVLVCILVLVQAKAHAVTPEQAIESVRQFSGDANLVVNIVRFCDDDPVDLPGGHYNLEAEGGLWAGWYEVRATDGRVIEMMLDDPEPDVATLTRDQAQAKGDQFLRQHYPRFDQCQWFVWPAKYGNNGPLFNFARSEILNQYGTLAPHRLDITVDGVTGRTVVYFEPLGEITGPTVPQITRDQAIQMASPYAICDPAAAPFSEFYLMLAGSGENQSLLWTLIQFPNPEQWDLDYGVYVDAITGEMDYMGMPMGGFAPERPPNCQRAIPPLPKQPLVRSSDGREIGEVREEGKRLWVRANVFGGFGAKVEMKPKLKVTVADHVFTAKDLGAKKRDYGWWVKGHKPTRVLLHWWVPLDRAVKKLGWRMEWSPEKQEAVVYVNQKPDSPAKA